MGTYIKTHEERHEMAEKLDNLVGRAEFINFSEVGFATLWDARAEGQVKWEDAIFIERYKEKMLPVFKELEVMEEMLEEQVWFLISTLRQEKEAYLRCPAGPDKNAKRLAYHIDHDWLIKVLEQLQASKKYLLVSGKVAQTAWRVITTLMDGKDESSFPVEFVPYLDKKWLARKSNEVYALGSVKKSFRDDDGFIRKDRDIDDVLTLLSEYGIEFKAGRLEHHSGSL